MRPSFPYRRSGDLYPEMLQRLQQEVATKAAADRVAAAAPIPQPEIQIAPAPSAPDIDAHPISKENKEKPAMSASSPRSPRKNRYAPRFRKNSTKVSRPVPSPDRHARKCSICNHADREAIDAAFLQWRSPDSIAFTFQLLDRRVIFRHASATGLYQRRRLNFRCSLENILERGDQLNLTAFGFVAAIRAYASLDDAGHWNEPVRRAVISNEYVHSRAAENPRPALVESTAPSFSDKQIPELETNLTHTK